MTKTLKFAFASRTLLRLFLLPGMHTFLPAANAEVNSLMQIMGAHCLLQKVSPDSAIRAWLIYLDLLEAPSHMKGKG